VHSRDAAFRNGATYSSVCCQGQRHFLPNRKAAVVRVICKNFRAPFLHNPKNVATMIQKLNNIQNGRSLAKPWREEPVRRLHEAAAFERDKERQLHREMARLRLQLTLGRTIKNVRSGWAGRKQGQCGVTSHAFPAIGRVARQLFSFDEIIVA
jgi:hypothetical protein